MSPSFSVSYEEMGKLLKKRKKSIIISIDTFDQIQHTLMTNTVSKLGIERNALNLIKTIYEKSIDDIMSVVKE